MEAWAEPTKKYWGIAWPTTICVWKNDVISWNNKTQELEEMGKVIVDKLLGQGLEELEKEIIIAVRKIDDLIENFNSYNDSVKKFSELYEIYLHWFVLGVTEPPGIYGEKLLENRVKDKKLFSILTSPTKKSFSRMEFEELLMINDRSGLEKHAKKYHWLHNNYFTTEILDKDF